MRSRSIFGWGAAVVAAGMLVLPATVAAQQTEQDTEADRPQEVAVRVDNHSWLDMHVYALRSDAPLRSLGIVAAQASRVFHLPADVALAGADLRVVADPVGSTGVYVSDAVLADPESEVFVTLENSLGLSHMTVGRRRDRD